MDEVFIRKEDLNKWEAKYFPNKDLISINDLLDVITDLDSDVTYLKEKIEDMEQDIQDNYRRISVSEQVGISDKDFI